MIEINRFNEHFRGSIRCNFQCCFHLENKKERFFLVCSQAHGNRILLNTKAKKVSIVEVFSSGNTGLLHGNLCWISRNNRLELIEVCSTNKVSLGLRHWTRRDDLYWTSKKSSLELIELSSIYKVSLVQ